MTASGRQWNRPFWISWTLRVSSARPRGPEPAEGVNSSSSRRLRHLPYGTTDFGVSTSHADRERPGRPTQRGWADPGPVRDEFGRGARGAARRAWPLGLRTNPELGAGAQGFEPRLTGPEPVVLPLHHAPRLTVSLPEASSRPRLRRPSRSWSSRGRPEHGGSDERERRKGFRRTPARLTLPSSVRYVRRQPRRPWREHP